MSFISFVGTCNRWGTDNLLDGVGNGWANMFGCHFRLVLSTRSRWHFQRKKVQTNDFIYRKSNSKHLKQSIFCQKMIACTGYWEIVGHLWHVDAAHEACTCSVKDVSMTRNGNWIPPAFHSWDDITFASTLLVHTLELWSYSFKENRTKKSILILQDWLMSQKIFPGGGGGFKGIIIFFLGGGGEAYFWEFHWVN